MSPLKPLPATRVEWFACACCPPNLARFIPQIPAFLYSTGPRELRVHQFASSRAELSMGPCDIAVEQETEYPWDGRIAVPFFARANRRPGEMLVWRREE